MYTLEDLINAYMCGYGDRDAKLTPFHDMTPKEYFNIMINK